MSGFMQDLLTWPYVLRAGHSDNPAHGACAMDAVNWLVHGEHGDAPECACPVIRAYVIRGNDSMPDDVRQRLLPYLHRIAGSRSASHEGARVRVLQLAALRVFAPRALDAAGLHDHAQRLRDLPDDVDMKAAAAAAERAATWAAERAAAAAWAAERVWEDYFLVLDQVLNTGPQGEPWSTDAVDAGRTLFVAAGGVAGVGKATA